VVEGSGVTQNGQLVAELPARIASSDPLSDWRMRAPVGRPRTGGVRDLASSPFVYVDGVDLAVDVV